VDTRFIAPKKGGREVSIKLKNGGSSLYRSGKSGKEGGPEKKWVTSERSEEEAKKWISPSSTT